MTDKLYRQEAMDARSTSLHGRVVLGRGLGGWAATACLCVLLLALGAWLLTRQIDGTALWRWIGAQF